MAITPTPTVSCFAGDAIDFWVSVLGPTGNPYNLTGVQSITYQMAEGYGSPIVVAKSLDDGISITNAVSGKYTISLVEADTIGFQGNLVHASSFVDSQGNTNTVFSGIIVFVPIPYF